MEAAVDVDDLAGGEGQEVGGDAGVDVHATPIRDVMTTRCKTIGPKALAAEAVHLMETHQITALPVVDEHGVLVGALNVHDLLRAGVV